MHECVLFTWFLVISLVCTGCCIRVGDCLKVYIGSVSRTVRSTPFRNHLIHICMCERCIGYVSVLGTMQHIESSCGCYLHGHSGCFVQLPLCLSNEEDSLYFYHDVVPDPVTGE